MEAYLYDIDSDLQPSDLLFVFGTRRRELLPEILSLWNQGLARYILVSGGINRTTQEVEADWIAQSLIREGVPEDKILIENRATNTKENVVLGRELIEATLGFDHVRSMIALGKAYASRRYLMTIARWFPPGIKVYLKTYYPPNFETNHVLQAQFRELVLAEYDKIPVYVKKGDIIEVDLSSGFLTT